MLLHYQHHSLWFCAKEWVVIPEAVNFGSVGQAGSVVQKLLKKKLSVRCPLWVRLVWHEQLLHTGVDREGRCNSGAVGSYPWLPAGRHLSSMF